MVRFPEIRDLYVIGAKQHIGGLDVQMADSLVFEEFHAMSHLLEHIKLGVHAHDLPIAAAEGGQGLVVAELDKQILLKLFLLRVEEFGHEGRVGIPHFVDYHLLVNQLKLLRHLVFFADDVPAHGGPIHGRVGYLHDSLRDHSEPSLVNKLPVP